MKMTKAEMIEAVIPAVRADGDDDINVAIHIKQKVIAVYGVSVSVDYAFRVWDGVCREEFRRKARATA